MREAATSTSGCGGAAVRVGSPQVHAAAAVGWRGDEPAAAAATTTMPHACTARCAVEHVGGWAFLCRASGRTHVCGAECGMRVPYAPRLSVCVLSGRLFEDGRPLPMPCRRRGGTTAGAAPPPEEAGRSGSSDGGWGAEEERAGAFVAGPSGDRKRGRAQLEHDSRTAAWGGAPPPPLSAAPPPALVPLPALPVAPVRVVAAPRPALAAAAAAARLAGGAAAQPDSPASDAGEELAMAL